MKKIVVAIFALIILIFIGYIGYKPLVHSIREKQVEKDVVNFLNHRSNRSFPIGCIYELEYAMKNNDNIYDISQLIERYINVMNSIVKSKSLNQEYEHIKSDIENQLHGLYLKDEFDEDRYMYQEYIKMFIENSISQETITSYDESFIKNLVKEIEKTVEHRSDKIYEDWYISGNEKKEIELPYNCYLEYTPSDKVRNDVKEILSCKLAETDSDYDFNDDTMACYITYKKSDGSIDTIERGMNIKHKNNQFSIAITLNKFLYTETQRPTVVLKSRDVVKKKQERDRLGQMITDSNNWRKYGICEPLIDKLIALYDTDMTIKEIHEEIGPIRKLYRELLDKGLTEEEANKILMEKWGVTEESTE